MDAHQHQLGRDDTEWSRVPSEVGKGSEELAVPVRIGQEGQALLPPVAVHSLTESQTGPGDGVAIADLRAGDGQPVLRDRAGCGGLPVPLPIQEEPNMGYVTHRDGRWYAVSYEGLDPLTGRDRRR